MKSVENIKISYDIKIKKAMEIISNGALKIAVVTDKNGKLLGTLTDGDIRRGFLKGLNLNNSIKSIYQKKPTIVKKSDSKKKILNIALSKKISQIPVIDENGIVIGLEVLEDLIEPSSKSNLVVIMAGGMGMRLRPLTKHTPKPMLKIGDKPILQILIEKFKESGFKNFLLCINYKSEIIKNFFKNGKKFGVNINYVHENKRLGTAGALSLIKKKPKIPFFVINGDLLINLNFQNVLDFHIENKSFATMCVNEYSFNSPYGEVSLNNENILSIKEKPKHKFFANAGIYVLDPLCLDLVPKKYFNMTSLFEELIKNKYKSISFPLGEYWLDIGRYNDFEKANKDFRKIFKK